MIALEQADVEHSLAFQETMEWLLAFTDPFIGGCFPGVIEDMSEQQLRAFVDFMLGGIKRVGELYEITKAERMR